MNQCKECGAYYDDQNDYWGLFPPKDAIKIEICIKNKDGSERIGWTCDLKHRDRLCEFCDPNSKSYILRTKHKI